MVKSVSASPVPAMSIALASAFAKIGLENIIREYPNKLDHVMNHVGEVRSPRALHPTFYGSYDWHSSVHMHWLLARLLRDYPELPESTRIQQAFDSHFTEQNINGELAYLGEASRESFERTYGWAWLLKLQVELMDLGENLPAASRWRERLQPLADAFVIRYLEFLPLPPFPIRAGTHANSAFGLLFAFEYAERAQHVPLRKVVSATAERWFARDRDYPAGYEPSGDDFLSPGLVEAALMSRLLDATRFSQWWEAFCPRQASPEGLVTWLKPVEIDGLNRNDPKLAHLDGLNLSRAWCWKSIVGRLPAPLQQQATAAIDSHIAVALPHTISGDYVGTHWLASFALLALSARKA